MDHPDASPDTSSLHSSHELAQRRAKLEQLEKTAGSPYAVARFEKTHSAKQVHDAFNALQPGEETEQIVHIAGRVTAVRNSGMFVDLTDDTGKLQVYHNIKTLDERQAGILKLMDLGDIVGVTGHVRRTPRGEISVSSHTTTILAKALEPPPEKYHGLKNVEYRFRHREQDLATSEQTRTTLRARYRMISTIRQYLYDRSWLEVETPMLHVIAGGALAKPFTTHHNALDMPLYLRIAPELHLKRLVIGGLAEKIFEINRNFRNEGLSPRHNPEFTMIELYQAYVDFTAMMDLSEALVSHVATVLHGTTRVMFQGQEIDFTPPWPRRSMTSLVREHTGLDLEQFRDPQDALREARKIGLSVENGMSWGQIVEVAFGDRVEKKLVQPVHVTDLPKDISPLAKAWPDRPWLAQRFETYVNTWEIANAFSELNDPREQRARFEEQAEQKRGPDEPPHPVDEDFLKAMAFGMPPMGGMGIGIDRLAMLMTDSPTIREVIAFPTMRPVQE
ncbi:MAG: lysine--tRNA ligase [Pseudomonadota bacterium]|nr:lysine--tRNA ligase [Pseudomonadota bacterium]